MSLPYDKGDESGSVPSTSDSYPYGAVVYTTAGAATVVTLTTGLPVQPQTASTWAVSAASLPLPSGAATSANQSTANTSLASIDGKLPALGQALAAGSVPVVLTAAQLATLTPLTSVGITGSVAVTGTFWQATQPVSIAATVTVTGAGGTFPVTDSGGSLTVDAPAGTPVFVRLSNGSAAVDTVPVSLSGSALAVTEKWLNGSTQDTPLSTAATLANNALALSGAYTPTDLNYPFADVTFSGTFGTAPTANTGLSVWFLRSDDSGATYEDGDASTTPARAPDVVVPVRAVNTAQVVTRAAAIPPGTFKVLLRNDGTGQTINSGWTLKVRPFTRRGS